LTEQPYTVPLFRQSATIAIKNIPLQGALEGATARFSTHREEALASYPQADALRDHFKRVRSATLGRLGEHLEAFERNAIAAGATVHWAATPEEAGSIVTKLAQDRGVSLVTKSKSMTTEEIHLNERLQSAGIIPVETDSGSRPQVSGSLRRAWLPVLLAMFATTAAQGDFSYSLNVDPASSSQAQLVASSVAVAAAF
jgi:hypothetical protein